MVSRQIKHFTSPKATRKKHQGISLADKKRIEERRQQALQLRLAGATLHDIVSAGIGYNNTQMVSKDLDRALDGFYTEDIEKLLVLDLARLDEIQKYCTIALRQGDTSQARNLMAIMQFRRETLGITPELLQDKRNEASRIVNNGIMVVQGTTRDYLASMMEASGASPEEVETELRELERATSGNPEIPQGATPANNAGAHAQTQARVTSLLGDNSGDNLGGNSRVIQGEIVPETSTEAETETGASKQDIKPAIKLKVRVKRKPNNTPVNTEPPPGNQGTSTTRSLQRVRHIPSESLESLSQRVEEAALHMDQEHEKKTTPRLGRLSDPVVIPAGEKVLEIPVKLPDANRPVSPGVVYKNAPRKPTQEEGRRLVTRRMGRDISMDRIRTRVREEPID